MPDQFFLLETKSLKLVYLAKNKDYAFAKFFRDVADEKIAIKELGSIVILNYKKDQYPFRVAPLLYQMKLISQDIAVSNIMACAGVTQKEAEEMLTDESFKDGRLIPLIEELKREEHK